MRKAFTLIELMVAVGILAMILSFASVIFRVSIDSHRTAIANAEIMQKLRAITDQLNADFKGLRKDGEIFVTWVAAHDPCNPNSYERLDRIMFFSDGDFQSYQTSPMVRGNVARICYMLAKKEGIKAEKQQREKRILARTQHILKVDDLQNSNSIDLNTFTGTVQQWFFWNNRLEYDKLMLDEWKNISWVAKQNMLSVITDVKVDDPNVSETAWGANVNPAEPDSIHMLLCEGVGEFKIQGWSDSQQRWIPEIDPDGDGDLVDSHFFLPVSDRVPGVLYPYRAGLLPDPNNNYVQINHISYSGQQVNEANFNSIPGLGRALKFTFTLYDSMGIIKKGRTFTHIVYLSD